MSRKMIGAILLPIPFAALPVVVVLAGALFSSGGASDDLVTRDTTAQVDQALSSGVTSLDEDTLARANVTDGAHQDCDFGLEGEF